MSTIWQDRRVFFDVAPDAFTRTLSMLAAVAVDGASQARVPERVHNAPVAPTEAEPDGVLVCAIPIMFPIAD